MFHINKGSKKGYIVHDTPVRYLLCRIQNEYDTKEEAQSALAKLLTDKVTEKNLLKDYAKKESW